MEQEKKTNRSGHGSKACTAHRIPEERYAAARAIYESTPGITYAKLADDVGISWRSLEERGRKEGWTKRHLLPAQGMSDYAQEVANAYQAKLSDFGPNIAESDKERALKETATELAVELRAQVISRHRQEWGAIRKLIYTSIKDDKPWKDDDNSKRAKILAEALQIVQSNERKAWGIDKNGEAEPKMTIVIERD